MQAALSIDANSSGLLLGMSRGDPVMGSTSSMYQGVNPVHWSPMAEMPMSVQVPLSDVDSDTRRVVTSAPSIRVSG